MKAAVILEAGQAPVHGDFRDPAPAAGKTLIRVAASSISHVTRARASGSHYSAGSAPPFIPGMDGTGRTQDGKRVYFLLPDAPFGAMAEQSLVATQHTVELPDGLSDATAAAMAIPAMSAWAALIERARMRENETVLINGATGTSGRLAIQVAKHLGAQKIIATGRRTEAFADLRRLGADLTIALTEDRAAMEEAFKAEFRHGIGIVLDYVYGPSAEAILGAAAKAGPEGMPVRFVQIGSIGGASIPLPAHALRASGLELMGSGLGSVPLPNMLKAIHGVLHAAPKAGFEIATREVPLAQVNEAWKTGETEPRIVLMP